MKTSIKNLCLLPVMIAGLGVIPIGDVVAQSGIITTVAGNGTSGYTGDNGAAINAELDKPYAVAVDASGNLVFDDTGNNVTRKVGANGIISTVAGDFDLGGLYFGDGGLATNAGLSHPNGVAVDTDGNIFIADQNNNVIRKVDTNGIITTVAGNGTSGYNGDNGWATNEELRFPVSVAADASGNLFVGDSDNNRIRKVDIEGVITTVAGNGYQIENSQGEVIGGGYSGDGGAATNAELATPAGVAVDASGNLFIADKGNNCIRKVGTNGIITTVAGNGTNGYSGDGGAATNAELGNPTGVAVDAGGNLFIADYLNERIRKVDASGIITTVAGNGTSGYTGDNGTATNAEFNGPRGVTVDALGNLFIVDNGNNRIRKVSASLSVILSTPQITVGYTNFTLLLSGPVGSNFVLQVSTNLLNWGPVSTSTIPVGGTITLRNAINHLDNGFYRVQLR
jgi:sugar lactone lactonase YvrE